MQQPLALSQLLRTTIERELPHLRGADAGQTAIRPGGPESWSPREELGHLIDSASNNHQRFVRASIDGAYQGPTYAQNDWVAIHGYQEMPWNAIIDFWERCNLFLADLVARIPESAMDAQGVVGNGGAVSLAFLIDDYVLHMQHHIDHILRREIVTQYPRAAAAKDM